MRHEITPSNRISQQHSAASSSNGDNDDNIIETDLAEHADYDEPGDSILEGPRAETTVGCQVGAYPSACPRFEGCVKVFNSVAATFYAPSDPSGVGGMQREHIRATPSWRRGAARNDSVFINTASEDGIDGEISPYGLIYWFELIANASDLDTGMWMVHPSLHAGSRELSVIRVNTIICACHLLSIFDADFAPENTTPHNVLDSWAGFYVNKFVDHYSFEIAS
ncbi:hypothetical protein DFH29DRAFT_1047447 [Suillus ampliporus]|nr:hypothetical protein DFH29DRAFT_1047447 [Suillus ampliporus]